MTLPSWIARALTGLDITESQVAATLAAHAPGPAYYGKITVPGSTQSIILHFEQGAITWLETIRRIRLSDGRESESVQSVRPFERIVEFRKG